MFEVIDNIQIGGIVILNILFIYQMDMVFICFQIFVILINIDEVKIGEQIVFQNRFWNEDIVVFFVGIYCILCFIDEGDSEVEDVGDMNENLMEGED